MAKAIIFTPIISQAVDLETGKFTQETIAFFRTILDLLNNSEFVLSDLTNDHGSLNGLGDDDHTQYYNLTRIDLWLGGKTTSNLTEGVNLYYTQARFNTAFASKDTDDLAEGSNLYYTQTRFDNAFAVKTTDNLSEGLTNLYFTNERSQDAVGNILTDTATINFTYNDVSNQITADIITTGDWTGTFDGREGSYYLDRGNHTGTETSSSISDFAESAQDAIGSMIDSTLVYVDGTPSLGRAAITGDISVPLGSNASTLATVNATVGSFGTATNVSTFTVNGKGLITNAVNTAIQIAESQVTNLVADLESKQNRLPALRVVTASGAITHVATDDDIVVNKTIGAATTVNLMSSPPVGQSLLVKDGKGDAGANNITITPASGTIDGAANLVINTNYGKNKIRYNGTEWNVVA